MDNHLLHVLGITGGIGSGKSTVAGILKEFGALVIDADKLCHQLLNVPEIKGKINNIWPDAVIEDCGEINRTKLGGIVFSDKENINRLNKILHPIVINEIKRQITAVKEKKKKAVIVIDAALLEEANLTTVCNSIIFVDTKLSLRRKRCKECRNWSDDEIAKRERFQHLPETKIKRATFVVNNNGTKSCTIEQVHGIWNKLNCGQ